MAKQAEFPDFQMGGWTTFLQSRASDGMFFRLKNVQTREDCTTILLSSGCPAKVLSNLYGLSQEVGGVTPTSGVVQHAKNLSLLLGAMQARMSLLLMEAVEQKEILPAGLEKTELQRGLRTMDTQSSESSGGSDWSSSSSDRRHRAEQSSGSTSDWAMPGSPSSSGTSFSQSQESCSSMESEGTFTPLSPTGSAQSLTEEKSSKVESSKPSSLTSRKRRKVTSAQKSSSRSKTVRFSPESISQEE